MKEQRFAVILDGGTEMTDEVANALYESGCDDASPGSCNGVAHVAFDREVGSLEAALQSAIDDILKAGFQPLRVEIDRDNLDELAAVSS